MEASNYEEIVRRRRARRQAEQARRRRKVLIIYSMLIIAVITVAVATYMLFSGRSRQAGAGPQGGDSQQMEGSRASQPTVSRRARRARLGRDCPPARSARSRISSPAVFRG